MTTTQNCLNCFAGEGFLTSDVDLSFDTGKNTTKAAFYVDNPVLLGKNAQPHHNKFYVVVYGKKARQCANSLSKGSKVSFSGSITTWARNNEVGVTVNADKVCWPGRDE